MTTLSLRHRYLAALGLSSAVLSACSANEAQPRPVTTPATAGTTEVATEPTATSAPTGAPTATSTSVAAAPTVAHWTPTVAPKSTQTFPTPGPSRPLPSCPSERFCIAEADASGAETAGAPFAKCALTVDPPNKTANDRRRVEFDKAQTTRERTARKDACCYEWVIPCPGGRPLVVEGAPRVASEAPRAEWLPSAERLSWEALRARVSHISPALRQGLADHYSREASFEHASVASFARVSLSLLAVGAPAALVAATHRAALDEIAHAEAMYLLASAHRGAPIGPGALDLTGASHVTSAIADIAEEAFFEGCVGEVAAALVLREEAERATDDEISAILASMAADEEKHAELAWRTVAWALSRHDALVRGVLERARQTIHAEIAMPIADEGLLPMGLPGITTARERALFRRRALVEVVAPCLDALLSIEAA